VSEGAEKEAAVSEPQTETPAQPVTAAEPQKESVVEVKGETQAEPQEDSQAEPQLENKPEPQAEPQSESKPESQGEPQLETKPEPQAEPQLETKLEPQVEPQLETKPELEKETTAEPQVETTAEPQSETAPEPVVPSEPTTTEQQPVANGEQAAPPTSATEDATAQNGEGVYGQLKKLLHDEAQPNDVDSRVAAPQAAPEQEPPAPAEKSRQDRAADKYRNAPSQRVLKVRTLVDSQERLHTNLAALRRDFSSLDLEIMILKKQLPPPVYLRPHRRRYTPRC